MKSDSVYSFEDFKRLANRQPNLEGNWVYRLRRVFYDYEMTNPYPKFNIVWDEGRLFLSFRDAVDFVNKQKKSDVYCNMLEQICVGKLIEPDNIGAAWLFDSQGNLLDYSTTCGLGHEIPDSGFFGRPEHRIHFKKGDIVEVIDNDSVQLAVLCGEVPSIEHCWDVYQRSLKREAPYFLDYSDDTAVILDGPSYRYHDHVSPLRLMKPHFPIPEEIRNDLQTWVERAETYP